MALSVLVGPEVAIRVPHERHGPGRTFAAVAKIRGLQQHSNASPGARRGEGGIGLNVRPLGGGINVTPRILVPSRRNLRMSPTVPMDPGEKPGHPPDIKSMCPVEQIPILHRNSTLRAFVHFSLDKPLRV